MVLNFPGLFGGAEIFGATAEDGQTDLHSGDRMIPGGIGGYSFSIEDITPGTMGSDNAVGTVAWTNPNNAKNNDGALAFARLETGTFVVLNENSIRLFDDGGNVVGNDKSNGDVIASGDNDYHAYGGTLDKWGTPLTPAIVNSVNFGVGFSAKDSDTTSQYLKASNWGFNLPSTSTILGIVVEIERRRNAGGPNTEIQVDHIKMTIYYLEDTI